MRNFPDFLHIFNVKYVMCGSHIKFESDRKIWKDYCMEGPTDYTSPLYFSIREDFNLVEVRLKLVKFEFLLPIVSDTLDLQKRLEEKILESLDLPDFILNKIITRKKTKILK